MITSAVEMLNPFKKGHQYDVAKNSFVIRINLLDGTSTEFNLQPNVTGNDCLDKVAQTLEMDLQEVNGLIEGIMLITQ